MFPSTRARVNGTEISLPGNKAIATTGAALALVSDEVCEALYNNIAGARYSSKYQGYVIPKTAVTNKRLPVFSVAVGDTDFINEDDLSFASADDSHWYGGIQSRGRNPFDILGTTFLKSIYAVSVGVAQIQTDR